MERLSDDELLSAYLDDELSAEERAYVEQLLADRPEARRLLDELRGVRESLQTLPSYKLEPDFGSQVLQRAEREVLQDSKVEPLRSPPESGDGAPHHDRRWRRPLLWSIVAAAAAVVLMFVDRSADRNRELGFKAPEPVTSSTAPVAAAAPAAPSPVMSKAKDDGYFSVMNGIPASPPAAAAPAGPIAPTAPTNDALDRAAAGSRMLNGGNLAGPAEPMDTLSAVQAPPTQVDVTPLVAENDYRRAESLIVGYNDVRRTATDDRAAARAFAGQVQMQQREERVQSRQSTVGEPPLIVSCVVSSADAVALGLEPVLRQQQIADLTTIRESQSFASFGTAADVRQNALAEVAKTARKAEAAVEEQYVYVVAERRQLEAALTELRRRSDLFNEVNVEPTATTIPSPVSAAAVAGAASVPSSMPKLAAAPPAAKADVAADEQAADKKSATLGGNLATNAAQPPLQIGGNYDARLDAVGQVAGSPGNQYGYVPQNLSLLSRSQRISLPEVDALATSREQLDQRRAGEKELQKQVDAPLAATTAAPASSRAPASATEGVNRPAPAAEAKSQDSARKDRLAADRDENLGVQPQRNDPLQPTPQLRGVYAGELPPDYQEALFIFRVAASPAEKSPSATPAGGGAAASPAAKPQATGQAK